MLKKEHNYAKKIHSFPAAVEKIVCFEVIRQHK